MRISKLLILILILPTINALEHINITHQQLPLNITLNATILNASAGDYFTMQYGDYLNGNSYINFTNGTSNMIFYNLTLIENMTPNIYSTQFDLLYNDAVIATKDYQINIYYNTSLYNITEPYINIERSYAYFSKYDVQLPLKYENDYVIEAPNGSIVGVSCTGFFKCNDSFIIMHNDSNYYDYPIKYEIPFGAKADNYHSYINFTIGNKSGFIEFETDVLTAEISVVEIPVDWNRSLEDLSFNELQWLFETLEQSSNLAIQKLEEANKTEIVEIEVEVDKPIPVVVDKDFLNQWDNYKKTDIKILAECNSAITELRDTIDIITQANNVLSNDKISLENKVKALEKQNTIDIDAYDKNATDEKKKRYTQGIFIIVGIVLYIGWEKFNV